MIDTVSSLVPESACPETDWTGTVDTGDVAAFGAARRTARPALVAPDAARLLSSPDDAAAAVVAPSLPVTAADSAADPAHSSIARAVADAEELLRAGDRERASELLAGLDAGQLAACAEPAIVATAGRILLAGGRDGAALAWLMRAVELGEYSAAASVGLIHERRAAWPQALSWYRVAAAHDDPHGHYMIWAYLSVGRAVARDLVAARHHLEAAARRGHPLAIASLAETTRQHSRRVEDLNHEIGVLDEEGSSAFDAALDRCRSERAGDRADVFRVMFDRLGGGSALARLRRVFDALAVLDPAREERELWASAYESRGLLYLNLARQTLSFRQRIEQVVTGAASPLADGDERADFLAAHAAYTEVIALRPGRAWREVAKLARICWHLGATNDAIHHLDAVIANAEEPATRVEARELRDEVCRVVAAPPRRRRSAGTIALALGSVGTVSCLAGAGGGGGGAFLVGGLCLGAAWLANEFG